MIIEPKVKGFICTTAHPVGCMENVKSQIQYIKTKGKINGSKKALIIGASTGYGLASRIALSFGCRAATIGVMFEKEASGKRSATSGYYNTKAFEKMAYAEGLYAKSINGDAFSREIKEQVIHTIKEELGQVDMVIYSLAAPRRTLEDGTTYTSVLKTIGEPFVNKSWNLKDNTIGEAIIPPASIKEVEATVKVMGGEDWKDWIAALNEAQVLAKHAITIAYSYIGPMLTYPIYYHGSIGMAKAHLKASAEEIKRLYANQDIRAYISINKAVVTQASSAIPIVPLYFIVLYKVMKEKGVHEGCIEQMQRMFAEKIFGKKGIRTDDEGMIRMDDLEMQNDVQEEVMDVWNAISTENVLQVADVKGYWEDFYRMFGFGIDGVDYSMDVPT